MKQITICHVILQTMPDEQTKGKLLLGGVGSLKPQIVQHFKISAVLTIMDDYMFKSSKVQERVQSAEIPKHQWINLQDDEQVNILPHFQPSHQFINKYIQSHNVLVHCQAGISRSASIVISYIMKHQNLSCQQATKFVRRSRYQIAPNQGFSNSLLQYEKILQQRRMNQMIEKRPQYTEILELLKENPFTDKMILTKYCHHIVSLNGKDVKDKGNLFLGQISAVKPHIIQNFKIIAVLTILDPILYKMHKIKENCEHMKVDNFWILMKDFPEEDIGKEFQKSFEYIQGFLEKGNVLVHCQAGVSRSASLVIAFLMKKFKIQFSDALKQAQERREQVNPNEGFRKQLALYEQKILK